MIAIKIKYVQKHKGRDGRVRYYFRHPRLPRLPLPDIQDSKFWAAYQAALGQHCPAAIQKREPGTFSSLCDDWMKSAEFQQLGPATRKNYQRILLRMQVEDFGSYQATDFRPKHIRRFIARKADTPAAANHWLRMFRLAFDFAVKDGRVETNPTLGVQRLKEKAEGAKSWDEAEIAAFEAKWPHGSLPRLAFALLLYTGQRRSDVVRMGWKDVDNGLIAVTQVKTGSELLIPIHPSLAAELEYADKSKSTFLQTSKGQSSTTGFYNRFVRWVHDAGLPSGLSPHGLRKAAARRLAEAGCTAHQIASITGHRTLGEVQRYTKAVDQARLAHEAMAKIGGGSFTKPGNSSEF